MSGTAQNIRSTIHLKGSTQIVTEYFGFSINSILFQRGIYPAEKFQVVNKYGLQVYVTKDNGLKAYLGQVLTQISEWLMSGAVQKLVLVISSATTNEVLERWVFDVETDKELIASQKPVQKSEKDIQQEIQAIMRQIAASVTYLPLLNEPCAFDLLVYADDTIPVPPAWEESDAKLIAAGGDTVDFKTFSTKIHTIRPTVSYKCV
ncbi:MAG: putative Mitotic spindle checkpoint protein MAD2 [Streblomastix strix]|uniref:Putative Mitotic spindle checkpoint protein MAD2 n=1 Tax=Streblomastix strix TaxID=222440 RepID=A0A5J4X1K4_9EUKA|nr:MAG: putative Mitotic spindle checkpoint protein MAD2 [Streblomastix strix]